MKNVAEPQNLSVRSEDGNPCRMKSFLIMDLNDKTGQPSWWWRQGSETEPLGRLTFWALPPVGSTPKFSVKKKELILALQRLLLIRQ